MVQNRRASISERTTANIEDIVTAPLSPDAARASQIINNAPTATPKGNTIWYLAYGSNLCAQTFLGQRGIRPLNQVNVIVPTFKLMMDLPGLPYWEPRFANVAERTAEDREIAAFEEGQAVEYLKEHHGDGNYEHGPLLGVVYEVTKLDFGKIIATEGGYDTLDVDCYTLPSQNDTYTESNPKPKKIIAKTLIVPSRKTRQSPEGQASLRYLNLLRDGAAEHALPASYQTYLQNLHHFQKTSARQKIGGFFLFLAWGPTLFSLFAFKKWFSDEDGRSPKWMMVFMDTVFKGIWLTYDGGWKKAWGEGEMTVEKGDEEKEVRDVETAERRPLMADSRGYGSV